MPADGPAPGRRVCRWAGALVIASAVILLPWAAYLAVTLPSSVTAAHWPLAWAGLDVAMAAGLGATGWLAIRRDRRVALVAASTATVLVADAWFDVCTAPPGGPLAFALMDMGIELGEAAACLLVAWTMWRDAPVRRPVTMGSDDGAQAAGDELHLVDRPADR